MDSASTHVDGISKRLVMEAYEGNPPKCLICEDGAIKCLEICEDSASKCPIIMHVDSASQRLIISIY